MPSLSPESTGRAAISSPGTPIVTRNDGGVPKSRANKPESYRNVSKERKRPMGSQDRSKSSHLVPAHEDSDARSHTFREAVFG